MNHDDLVRRSARWLKSRFGCLLVLAEMRTNATYEQPDVIGWYCGRWSVVVECKASRSDFRRDLRKFHKRNYTGMGHEHWYVAPAGVIPVAEVLAPVGLAEVDERGRITVVQRASPSCLRPRVGTCCIRDEISARELPFLIAALAKVQNGQLLQLQRSLGIEGEAQS